MISRYFIRRLGIVVFLCARAGSAQPSAAAPNQAVRTPVALTSNGAISVGAYEAGVNWIAAEFLRLSAYDPMTWSRISGVRTTRQFYLASAAGASAGNINSVLSAFTYCAAPTDTVLRAESSLFWKVWVSVGIRQLFPGSFDEHALKDVRSDPGPFSRSFFETGSWNELRQFRANAQAYPSCHVPVGITLTQLDTVSYRIAPSMTAPVQRLATVFDIRPATANDPEYLAGQLGFFPLPDRIAYRKSLGAVALIPELYAASPKVDSARMSARDSAVLWSMEAGSAVPPAFAPRWLCYVPPGDQLPSGEGDGASLPSTGHACHRFTDGGLFDNNPLALGYDLAEHVHGLQPQSNVLIGVSDPYRLRSRLLTQQSTRYFEDSTLGIGYLLQLGAGAIPAARRYELQAFGRQISRAQENDRRAQADPIPVIAISSRGAEIVGTQFDSFGAFLGRPFREFDFYAGVYDGLYFVASEFLCAGGAAAPPAEKEREGCAHDALWRLLKSNPLRLDPFTLHVVRWFGKGDDLVPLGEDNFKPSDAESLRLSVLRAILDSPAPPELPPKCDERGYIAKAICSSGFATLLHHLRTGKGVRAAIQKSLDENIECGGPDDAGRARCFVDSSFVALVDDPPRFIDKLVEDLLLRAWRVEKREAQLAHNNVLAYPSHPKSDAPVFHETHSTVIKAVQFAHRRFGSAARDGFQLDPSTVPDRHIGWSERFFHLFPYSISVGSGVSADRSFKTGERTVSNLSGTPVTAGWQPTWALRDRAPEFAIGLPLELTYYLTPNGGDPADSLGSLHTGFAGGLSAQFNRSRSIPFDVSLLLGNHLLKAQERRWQRPAFQPEIATTVKGSLRLAVRWTVFARAEGARRSEYAFITSLLDLNGVLYWLFR